MHAGHISTSAAEVAQGHDQSPQPPTGTVEKVFPRACTTTATTESATPQNGLVTGPESKRVEISNGHLDDAVAVVEYVEVDVREQVVLELGRLPTTWLPAP